MKFLAEPKKHDFAVKKVRSINYNYTIFANHPIFLKQITQNWFSGGAVIYHHVKSKHINVAMIFLERFQARQKHIASNTAGARECERNQCITYIFLPSMLMQDYSPKKTENSRRSLLPSNNATCRCWRVQLRIMNQYQRVHFVQCCNEWCGN